MCTCAFKSLKLVGYEIIIYSIAGMLDSFLNLSRDFYIYTAVRSCMQPSKIVYSGWKLFIGAYNLIQAETN